MGRFISYLRVSTTRQGADGLGIEAQRETVRAHVAACRGELLEEFVEVESGRKTDRTQLDAAIALCRLYGATLIIAKLDRLARNVAFVSRLMEDGLDFVACDFPQANRFTIHMLAAFAEFEREQIRTRTKAALAAAKARGVKLGCPPGELRLTPAQQRAGGIKGNLIRVAEADARAADVLREIAPLRAGGASLSAVARILTERGIPTPADRGRAAGKAPRGAAWTAMTVKRVLERAEATPCA